MLGIIEGCTHPCNISTLRGNVRALIACARATDRDGTLSLRVCGSSGTQDLSQVHRRSKQPRGQAFLDNPAQRLFERRARDPRFDELPADIDQMAVLDSARTGGLAIQAGQAAIQMLAACCA